MLNRCIISHFQHEGIDISLGNTMPFVNMKKASTQAGGGKSFAVRVTTMDAELEFSYIEVCIILLHVL